MTGEDSTNAADLVSEAAAAVEVAAVIAVASASEAVAASAEEQEEVEEAAAVAMGRVDPPCFYLASRCRHQPRMSRMPKTSRSR